MNKKIEKILKDECQKDACGIWETSEGLLDLLRDFDVLAKIDPEESRWWVEYRYIIKVKDTYIGYVYAETTGDMNAWEAGYEFDPDSVCEMKAVDMTITTYIVKGE